MNARLASAGRFARRAARRPVLDGQAQSVQNRVDGGDPVIHSVERLQTAPSTLEAAIECIAETTFPTRANEPSLHGYFGDLRRPGWLERFTRYHEDVLRFADFDPDGKRVLEVGSGFGLVLVWLASRGAHAHGVEIVPWMVEDVRRYVVRLPSEVKDRMTIRQGSASQLPYEDSSFDLVLSIEALSHYLEYATFLAEAHRVLRQGGKLLVVDGNNGLNVFTRRYAKRIWALHERDIVDDDDPWLFVPKRQRIIQDGFPELDTTKAHSLALRTAGMVRPQIEKAVRTYLATGKMPENTYKPGELSVHPEHEMVMERLFNPFALGKEIRSHGFETRIQGYWGGAGGRPIVRAANRVLAALSLLTMVTAPSFRIVAVKR
jgi:SAM-dependent methyltransferase